MLTRANFAYGLFIAVILVVIAILSVTGVFLSKYSTLAWYYLVAAVLFGGYVVSLVLFGKQQVDFSKGWWAAAVDSSAKAVGLGGEAPGAAGGQNTFL